MGVFVEQAELLGRALGALVMPIHHMGKDWTRGMRGSSALLAAADAVWQVAPEGERRIIVEKLKEAADGGELSFRLERHKLGIAHNGDEITTCVVSVDQVGSAAGSDAAAPPAASEGAPAPRPGTGSSAFLDDLALVIDEHGATRNRSKSIPQGERVVRQAHLGGFPAIAITATSMKSRRSQIDRFLRELERHAFVARHGGYVWLTDAGKLTLSREKERL